MSLESAHADLGATFTTALGRRLPADYGDPAQEYERALERVGVVDRTYRGLIAVTSAAGGASGPDGPDDHPTAALDGIFSSRVADLEIGQGQLSTFLNAKGKLVGAFRLFRVSADTCLLLFGEPHREEFETTLQKYAFLNDLEVRADRRATLSLEGPAAGEVVGALFGAPAPPRAPLRCSDASWNGIDVLLLSGADETPNGGVDLVVDESHVEALWTALVDAAASAAGGAVGFTAAEILRVEAGTPRFGVDFDGANFPHDARLEAALDYTKCYVGQEVVARMRTYGHANRRIVCLKIRAGDASAARPGAELLGPEGVAGHLTTTVTSPRLGPIALGMVTRRYWDAGTELAIGDRGGPIAEVAELPFDRVSGQPNGQG